jgi:hypothetical protein
MFRSETKARGNSTRKVRRSASDNRLKVGQSAFQVFSHHSVATDKDQDKLEKKRRLAVHGPGHDGLGTSGLQRKLLGVGATERFVKIELTTDKIVRTQHAQNFRPAGYQIAPDAFSLIPTRQVRVSQDYSHILPRKPAHWGYTQ